MVTRRLGFIGLVLSVGFAVFISGCGSSTFAAPPLTPQLPIGLGNPTGLTAAPGNTAGDVLLRWTPADNADRHFVYLVKPDGTDGRYWPELAGDAGSETITGLEPGGAYLFIVIAGQEQADGVPRWSEWSNWARGQARERSIAGLPPTPTFVPSTDTQTSPSDQAGDGHYEYTRVEVEGTVTQIDRAANTFTARILEVEHAGGIRLGSLITVDYGDVEFVERWIRQGRYIEVEGRYDSARNILRAYEVEREDSDDDRYYSTPTPSSTPTITPTPSTTPVPTRTSTPDLNPTITPTPSPSPTHRALTPTPSTTPVPTRTSTPDLNPTITPTPSPSPTHRALTPTPSTTPVPTRTSTPDLNPTITPTPSPSPTHRALTPTPSTTPVPTRTSTPDLNPTITPTPSPSPTHHALTPFDDDRDDDDD